VAELGRKLAADGKQVYFDVFRAYCLEDSQSSRSRAGEPDEGPTYGDVAARLGIKESDVRNYLTLCRKVLREILRERIREYVSGEDEIDRELGAVLGS
jgi:hypothetical protein